MVNPNVESVPQVAIFSSPRPPIFKWIILSLICLIILFSVFYAIKYILFTSNKNPALEKIVVRCPTSPEFCSKATTLKLALSQNRQKNEGLGWNLPKNTPIKAAFDGTFREQTIFGASPPARLITLRSPLGRYEARYKYNMDNQSSGVKQNLPINERAVKTGDILATIPGIPLTNPEYNGATLQFYIVDKTNTGKMVLLLPEDIKQKINLPKK